jgi:hypothetical protein
MVIWWTVVELTRYGLILKAGNSESHLVNLDAVTYLFWILIL